MITWDKAESIAIWGFGQEGQATLEFLQQRHCKARITILNDQELAEVDQTYITVITGESAIKALCKPMFDLVIKSPGISLYREEITLAKEAGVHFTSGTNLWFEAYPDAKTLVITGTKGKSTTIRLVAHLLEAANWDIKVIGNIGYPLLSSEPAPDLTLLELSSYQLADLEAKPDYCLLTNLFPEHIPWHISLENYYSDKLRLATYSEHTQTIANAKNEELRTRLASNTHDANNANNKAIIWSNTNEGYHVEKDGLYYAEKHIELDMPIPGNHNIHNLALACTALQALGIDAVCYLPSLNTFEQLPHRLQEFKSRYGQLCVNDSISTVPETTLAALESYQGKPITLIMGGLDRGQSYDSLTKQLKQHNIISMQLLPDTGHKILNEVNKAGCSIDTTEHKNLTDAVERALEITPKDGVILLSPGAPSYNQFRNFEERGEVFTRLCN